MAVYHAMAVLKEGAAPATGGCPLAPVDIVASSDEEALERAGGLMAVNIGEWAEGLDEAAAAKFFALAKRWEPRVSRVNRPAVDVEPRSWTTDSIHEGVVVGTRHHYGDETGEQSFDVLIDGKVCGLLLERRRQPTATMTAGQSGEVRIWRLSTATGLLAHLAGREWDDGRPPESRGFVWPNAALAGIRTELERS